MARPRSEQARREVLGATADMLAESGVDNLTIEEVACRSGVAKSTIYRHWPARSALVIDAVRSTFRHVPAPDTGSVRQDLLQLLEGIAKADLGASTGRIVASLLATASRDPEIDRLVRELAEERNRPARAILCRARERGELPADVDLDVAVAMVIGPLVFQRVHLRSAVDGDFLEACVGAALAGLGQGPAPAKR